MNSNSLRKVITLSMLVVFILFSFASAGSDAAKKEKKEKDPCKGKDIIIALEDLGKDFEKFSETRLNVFKEEPICWDKVDAEKYDKFFQEAFLTITYFRLAEHLINISNESVAKGISAEPDTDFVIAGLAIKPMIDKASPRVKSMIGTAKSMSQEAKNDFKGLKGKRKLPKATGNLKTITEKLKSIATGADETVKGLGGIGKAAQKKMKKRNL